MYKYLSIIFSITGWLFSLLSLILYLKERKKNKTILWRDIPVATNSMVEKMKKEFNPDIIFIPNEKGGILVNYLKKSLSNYIVCIFGVGIPKKRADLNKVLFIKDDFYSFSTSKWYAYIPKCIEDYKDKKILILDDFAMSGDFLFSLKEILIDDLGFLKNNIRTMCLATTLTAKGNSKAPDYYWKIFDTTKVYLPWGKPE